MAFSTAYIPKNWIVFMDLSTREVSVVLSTVAGSATEARTVSYLQKTTQSIRGKDWEHGKKVGKLKSIRVVKDVC